MQTIPRKQTTPTIPTELPRDRRAGDGGGVFEGFERVADGRGGVGDGFRLGGGLGDVQGGSGIEGVGHKSGAGGFAAVEAVAEDGVEGEGMQGVGDGAAEAGAGGEVGGGGGGGHVVEGIECVNGELRSFLFFWIELSDADKCISIYAQFGPIPHPIPRNPLAEITMMRYS